MTDNCQTKQKPHHQIRLLANFAEKITYQKISCEKENNFDRNVCKSAFVLQIFVSNPQETTNHHYKTVNHNFNFDRSVRTLCQLIVTGIPYDLIEENSILSYFLAGWAFFQITETRSYWELKLLLFGKLVKSCK